MFAQSLSLELEHTLVGGMLNRSLVQAIFIGRKVRVVFGEGFEVFVYSSLAETGNNYTELLQHLDKDPSNSISVRIIQFLSKV